jgi:hypothetical protein
MWTKESELSVSGNTAEKRTCKPIIELLSIELSYYVTQVHAYAGMVDLCVVYRYPSSATSADFSYI